MSDQEQCTICLESLKSPRQLPCRHSFCETCLQEYINKLVEGGKSINKFDCPNCRTSTASPSPGQSASEWALHFPQFPKADDVQIPWRSPIIRRKCSPCEYEGNIVDAPRYCTDCREYICEECYSVHKRMAVTRKHRVVKADEVGKVSGASSKQRCSCPWNKKLTFHCLEHQTYCCSKCKTDDHSNCGNVKSISAMSESIRLFGEIEKTLSRMNQIRENFQKIIDLSENNKSSLAVAKNNITDSIKKTHADLRSLLSQTEDVMIEELNTMYGNLTSGLTKHVGKCKTAMNEIDTSCNILKSAQSEEQNDQLYISHCRFLEEMVELEKALHETAAETMTSQLCFKSNEATKLIPDVLKSFGEISINDVKKAFTPTLFEVKLRYRKAKKCKSVKVPYARDPIGVAVLSNGCCIVVNHSNSIHMFDCNDQQTANLSMPGAWDVCVTGKNEVAVTTCDNKMIHFLSTDNGLNRTRTISTEKSCWGIAYCIVTKELVITTYNPNSVQILTLTGDVVKTIEKDKNGQEMFSVNALYVTVNDTGDRLYVSDDIKGVIGVDRDGNIKFIYTDVKGPCGISIDGDGNIYVCGYISNDVHQLSPDGSKIQALLSSTDGLTKLHGLYFNRRNDTVVLASRGSRNILVYNMQ